MIGISGALVSPGLAAFDRAAARVQAGTASAANTDDLVDGMVGLGLTAYQVKAGVAVLRANDQMLGSLLDLHA
jgi:hypothetical protein